MRHQHVGRIVQDLSVDFEERGDPSIYGSSPGLLPILLDLSRVKTDSVAPKVTNLADFKIQIDDARVLSDFVGIFDELEEELIEVSLDVHTLQLWIDVLVDEHEVGVDLKAAILTQHNANLELLSILVLLSNGAVLEQARH